MSGSEGAILAGANKGLASATVPLKLYDVFFRWNLDTSFLDKLETQLSRVEALLRDVDEKLIKENDIDEKWAQKAWFTIYDAEDFLAMILADMPKSNKVRTNFINTIENSDYSTEDKTRNKLKHNARAVHPHKKIIEEELDEIIKRLAFLAAQKDTLGLKEKMELSSYRKGRLSFSIVNETSFIYGRSVDTQTIMRLLNSREGNDDALRVIPIVGMSGIGKTTLACMVFHAYKSLNRSFGLPSWLGSLVQQEDNSSNPLVFDVKGWICVSDECDVKHVIKSLLESITGQKSMVDNNLEFLQRELKKKLQGKRFLIVLDDFWSNDSKNWNILQASFSVGVPGSRIIITTPSEDVAGIVTTFKDFVYELDKLSRNESWHLFETIVFRGGNSSEHPILRYIGLEIVNRCKGLPMAIKNVGALLRSKGYDELQWRSILNNINWEYTKNIPSFMLSYYSLPLGVRHCFAYCSIFPKDYSFTMEEVVMLWIGEGLIEKFCEGNQYEDVARTYFNHLYSKFFFQESSGGGSKFVMSDLVNNLTLNVSIGLCVDFYNVNVQSRRLSYIQGKDEFLLKYMLKTKLSHLRTFLPLRANEFHNKEERFYFNNKLFRDLLSNFKLLRVMSLSGYAISKLPGSVGDMKLLRYLDLSFTDIDDLPNKICRLTNLQILLLSGCWKLRRLPSQICNLINLRHLYIDGTNLKKMPDGIGRMTNIQTLSKFVIGRGKSKQMRELEEMLKLQGELHISELDNVEDTKDVVVAGFKKKEYLKELVLEWERYRERSIEPNDKEVLDAIEAHKNLKSLTIRGYGGKKLSDWIVGVSPSFTAMVSLCITDCSNCEALPSLGNLPFLKDLEMRRLDRLESIGEEFYGNSHNPFQSLEKLTIDGMKVLKTWCFPGGDRVAFQMLNDLKICDCLKLTKIPYCFPSLSRIFITSCDDLVKLEMCGEAEEGSSSKTAYRHPPFKSIRICGCPELEEIPNSFANSDSLEIEYCEKLVSVPRLQHVRTLTFSDVPLPVEAALQDCRDGVMEELTIQSTLSDLYSAQIHRFTSLKLLHLTILMGLKDGVGEVGIRLPPNLSELTLYGDTSRHVDIKILITEISNLHSLTKLHLSRFALESFPDVELSSTLKYLTVENGSALRNIPDRFLSGCSKSLQELQIFHCPNLECLPPSLSTLESLQTLGIRSCGNIHQLPNISHSGPNYLTNLFALDISDCGALGCLPIGFQKATNLHNIYLYNCPSLYFTEAFGFPANLRRLHIGECGKMKSFVETVLPTLYSLTHLQLRGFQDIRSLDHCLPESIQTLMIEKFPSLKSLSGVLPDLKNLSQLRVVDCPLVDPKSWS